MRQRFCTKIEKGKNLYSVWEDRDNYSLRYKHAEGDVKYQKCTVALTWKEFDELYQGHWDSSDALRTIAGYLLYKHAGLFIIGG